MTADLFLLLHIYIMQMWSSTELLLIDNCNYKLATGSVHDNSNVLNIYIFNNLQMKLTVINYWTQLITRYSVYSIMFCVYFVHTLLSTNIQVLCLSAICIDILNLVVCRPLLYEYCAA